MPKPYTPKIELAALVKEYRRVIYAWAERRNYREAWVLADIVRRLYNHAGAKADAKDWAGACEYLENKAKDLKQ